MLLKMGLRKCWKKISRRLNVKIKTDDLVNIIDILKKNIMDNFPQEVEVDKEDFYWQLSEDDIYHPAIKPTDIDLGQLSDDWLELQRLIVKEGIPISYDLRRLAVILQVVRKKSIGLW